MNRLRRNLVLLGAMPAIAGPAEAAEALLAMRSEPRAGRGASAGDRKRKSLHVR